MQRIPFRQATPKIGFQAFGGLIALFGILGEELHGQRRHRLGERDEIAWRRRPPSNVAMDPLQWVSSSEWQRARKHLVQGDA
jgi:hypothetical protein